MSAVESASLLAVRVLRATTFADKVADWPKVDVRDRFTGAVPELRRPLGLELPTGRRTLPSITKVRLDQEHGRARVLHELMNHELQAIELLAWALVRWPEAPAGFRRALVATLRDEQRHCRLYAERLEATGGEVGQQAVSGFFWETLTAAQDPAAFCAGLSLCFESANLDFCRAWKTRFQAAGDLETALVLQHVYDDEVRHVATGLVWFSRWAEGDRLDAWERALVSPLTAARSRGKGFDRDGRLRAGFTEAEVERLRLAGGSRGRPPRVLSFDAGVEDRVAGRPCSRMARAVNADLATLPMFLAGGEDVVVAAAPSLAFLSGWADVGLAVPRFVELLNKAAIGPHPVQTLEPWGPVPDPDPNDVVALSPSPAWRPSWRALSSKTESLRRALALGEQPGWVQSPGAVWTHEASPPAGEWVMKAPFSTSGTARIRGRGPLDDRQRAWLTRTLAADGEVVVQPWFDRVVDVSVHVTVSASGVRVEGATRFETAANGSYRGAWLGPWTRGLAPDVLRAIHDRSTSPALSQRIVEAGEAAGQWAHTLGYEGALSVDCAVVLEGAHHRVVWLETNARRTLGRVALALSTRVDRRVPAFWRVERFSAKRAAWLGEQSIERGPQGLCNGIIATNDPSCARTLLTWVAVGADAVADASFA